MVFEKEATSCEPSAMLVGLSVWFANAYRFREVVSTPPPAGRCTGGGSS